MANANIAHAQVLAEISKVSKKKAAVKPVDYLDQDALETLLRQPDTNTNNSIRDLTILSMLYNTAARATEILTLKSSDLHINVRNPYAVLTGKGSKVRSVPLMKRTITLIEVYSILIRLL